MNKKRTFFMKQRCVTLVMCLHDLKSLMPVRYTVLANVLPGAENYGQTAAALIGGFDGAKFHQSR